MLVWVTTAEAEPAGHDDGSGSCTQGAGSQKGDELEASSPWQPRLPPYHTVTVFGQEAQRFVPFRYLLSEAPRCVVPFQRAQYGCRRERNGGSDHGGNGAANSDLQGLSVWADEAAANVEPIAGLVTNFSDAPIGPWRLNQRHCWDQGVDGTSYCHRDGPAAETVTVFSPPPPAQPSQQQASQASFGPRSGRRVIVSIRGLLIGGIHACRVPFPLLKGAVGFVEARESARIADTTYVHVCVESDMTTVG